MPRVPVEKALNENKEMSIDERLSKITMPENKKDSELKLDEENL